MSSRQPETNIVFVRDSETGVNSLVVDSVVMASWIDKQMPSWVKKLAEVIERRRFIAENA